MQSLVMRNARLSFAGVAAVVLLLSCNGESPTAPTVMQPVPPAGQPVPPAATTGIVWGTVYQKSGACILGATVEMLDGPQAGARLIQNVCGGYWDDSGEPGYLFRELPPNTDVRLRAAKEDYRSQEITLHVTAGGSVELNFFLENP
jgi:hypothetical protein